MLRNEHWGVRFCVAIEDDASEMLRLRPESFYSRLLRIKGVKETVDRWMFTCVNSFILSRDNWSMNNKRK